MTISWWSGADLSGRPMVQLRVGRLTVWWKPHGRGIAGTKAAFLYHSPPRLQFIWQAH